MEWPPRCPALANAEWKGFRSDLPREFNPERGYIATANDNSHPPGYKGRPVLFRTSVGVQISRIALNPPDARHGPEVLLEDHERMQHDAYSLRAERDLRCSRAGGARTRRSEARAMIEGWDKVLTKDSAPAAIYVRWTATEAARQRETGRVTGTNGHALVETGLRQALDRLTKAWGADWSQWRYGRINTSTLDHQFIPEYAFPPRSGRVDSTR